MFPKIQELSNIISNMTNRIQEEAEIGHICEL